MTSSLPPSYFDALYADDPDPWRFATSDYERMKYAHTLAALPAHRFGSALEVGCSIGVLTRQLAERCDALLSIDVAERALARAREVCADAPNVRLERRRVPQEWPEGQFDLIVLSEVLYYLDADDLARTAALTSASLTPGGSALLVHFTEPTNYPQSGDGAVESFLTAVADRLAPVTQERRERYRLDRLDAR